MSLKTNIIRLQSNSKCICYQTHFNIQLNNQDISQIQYYIETLDNNLIYAHPFLYSNSPITINILEILLSRGQTASANFQLIKQLSIYDVLQHICGKMLKSLDFLPYKKIKTYFNPFEEKSNCMPGLYIQPVYQQSYSGFAFLPVNLLLDPPVQISSAKILLNYSSGRFYDISEIVRVDKQKNIIHFRNGQTINISSLKKGKIKYFNGYELAQKLKNYLDRIKENCKIFFQNWSIKLQANFFSIPANLITVGSILLRDNKQKQLNDIVFPMVRHSYNHSYRELFKTTQFQSGMQAELKFIIPLPFAKQAKHIIHQFQKLSEKMTIKLKISHTTFLSLESRQELTKNVSHICTSNALIYILLTPKQPNSVQQQNITYFKQEMINKQFYFHQLHLDAKEQADQFDMVAIRNLAILYCKMRLAPWKIKNIPFGDKPTVAFNIDVQQTAQGKYSIAAIMTMNAFFSKFTCSHAICTPERVQLTIYNLIYQSLLKFIYHHKIYPFRIFVFRTGIISSLAQQHKSILTKLIAYYQSINNKNNSTLTYILLKHTHSFCTFVQNDQNYISRMTIKKTQLLTATCICNRFYVQLEFDQPPMEIQIHEQQKDPGFNGKVLELIAKLCYGSVGNQFGKGVGFLGYAAKLNKYKDFNLKKWEKYLQEGVMLFL